MKFAPEDKIKKQALQYATLDKALGGVYLILDVLPDPDKVLRKAGKGVEALRDLLVDDQMEACWNVRKAALKKTGWHLVPGGESAGEKQACAELLALFSEAYDMDRIQGEMIEAAALGFSPLEILWLSKGGKWIPSDLVGKPTEWFCFGEKKELRFRTSYIVTEEAPVNRFLIVSNGASYANPYGSKQFSKCYWPVQFKRNGWRWWALFVEKFGGSFLTGAYDENATPEDKKALLDGLYNLISGGAAIFPEKTKVNTISDSGKSMGGTLHQKFEEFSNAAISKVLLGQTLTTEVLTGSMAAANVHNLVREDIRLSDLKMCSSAWNRLCKMYTLFNYGDGVKAPRFSYEGEEDLQTARASRDINLKSLGVQFNETYFKEVYGLSEDHFSVSTDSEPQQGDFSVEPSGLVTFSQDKASDDMMNDFMADKERDGQEIMDKMIELFQKEVESADSWEAAQQNLMKKIKSKEMYSQRKKLAGVLNNVRYVGVNTGASDA